jgi:pyruvate/2-oxoglutarate dehydrogenase complex dihydrolipoamide acyltransferase (E2) component
MLEIVLTREDANTEYALLAEWLVEDRVEVTAGQPVCVVETTKATVEVEAPGPGTIVQLYAENVEVELGKTIAYVAESADELASIDTGAQAKPAAKPAAGDRKATRKAVELAELQRSQRQALGIDLQQRHVGVRVVADDLGAERRRVGGGQHDHRGKDGA